MAIAALEHLLNQNSCKNVSSCSVGQDIRLQDTELGKGKGPALGGTLPSGLLVLCLTLAPCEQGALCTAGNLDVILARASLCLGLYRPSEAWALIPGAYSLGRQDRGMLGGLAKCQLEVHMDWRTGSSPGSHS